MTEKLDKVRARIAALRAKTRAAGCTEAEALAAAEAAARIMAEHGLTDADIEMTQARARETTSRATWRTHVLGSVMHVTNTAAILLPDCEAVEFVGRDPGPEIAAYLYQVLTTAVLREQALFKATPTYKRRRTVKTRRAALQDFADGMVVRLRSRLLELFRPTLNAEAQREAKNALRLRHTDTKPLDQKDRKNRFDDARGAGWRAGGNVTLSHGVAGPDGRPLAIEHKS